MGKLSKLVDGIQKINSHLDMSQAARMERAREMGFDTDIYHKTWGENFGDGGGFTEFSKDKMQQSDYGYAGKGVYATIKPLGGSTYGNVTMNLKTNIKNPYRRNAANWQDEIDPYQWIPANSEKFKSMDEASSAWTEMMKSRGYDGFVDDMPNGETVIFDPKNIRSVNAAFDPAKKESSNLLAGIGGLGAGTAAALYTPEQNQAYADKLRQAGIAGPDYGSITSINNAMQQPVIQKVGNWMQQNLNTPYGNPVGGIANYMQNFGDNATSGERLERAFGAALDLL